VVNLSGVLTELLKTNIFSVPVSAYVLILCLSCISWLFYFSYVNKQGINKLMLVANKLLAITLSCAVLGYMYIVLYKGFNIQLFIGGRSSTLLSLCLLAFTTVYLISLLYCSVLILIKERYPFLLFACINAFGAQIMLMVADSRFAGSYKIMFPSLLLMSIYIVYSFLKFHQNKVFLSFALLALALSLGQQTIIIVALAFVVLSLSFIPFSVKYLKSSMVVAFILLGLFVFGSTYSGYEAASYAQNFNLDAIEQYHQSSDKSLIKLKKVPPAKYGYNIGNWNDLPYFMKQCYGIDENTVIQYYE
jgi:hypothetical protein